MDFDDALTYLLSLGHETLTIKLGLANTETLLTALGNPQKNFPAVQIAGTNGKGSAAVMLDSICRAAGIRAGLFTSPHLISITERIKVNGEQISEHDFARITAVVKATAEELVARGRLETLPTFFEQVTAIALLTFCEANVQLAILETGLGGRLDSTSAARADVVAITSIAMDHEEYLGNTIAQIAAEKGAIIRPGVTAVIAPQPKEALDVIVRQCNASRVEPIFVGVSEQRAVPGLPTRYRRRSCTARLCTAPEEGRYRITIETPHDTCESVLLGLRGRHQVENAATAVALAEALTERGFAISRGAFMRGLEAATHPGRLDLWEGRPQILFDGAHNPAAARALRSYLDGFVSQPITMIFGAMRDKRLNEMAGLLFPKANKLILTELDNPRAADLEMLAAATDDKEDQRVRTASGVREALEIAKQLTPPDGLICVTGSLYLVGAVQEILTAESRRIAHQRA